MIGSTCQIITFIWMVLSMSTWICSLSFAFFLLHQKEYFFIGIISQFISWAACRFDSLFFGLLLTWKIFASGEEIAFHCSIDHPYLRIRHLVCCVRWSTVWMHAEGERENVKKKEIGTCDYLEVHVYQFFN